MLLRIATFLCTVLVANPLLAQGNAPDSTTASRYFPLDIGNTWEYRDDSNSAFERRTIAADTLIDGVRFFRYQQQALDEEGNVLRTISNAYLRYDEHTTELRYWEEGDLPPYDILTGCPLNAPFGSTSDCVCGSTTVSGGYAQRVTIGDDVIVTSAKTFDTQSCEQISTYAADIGFTTFFTIGGTTMLEYAQIGDQEYGEPRVVSAEPQGSTPAAVTLAVFPNPVDQKLHMVVSQSATGQVVVNVRDVLGRDITTLHAGALTSEERTLTFHTAALAPGTYLLRVVGTEGVATRRFTVAR